jgi:ketosteroid isomerase-like protein
MGQSNLILGCRGSRRAIACTAPATITNFNSYERPRRGGPRYNEGRHIVQIDSDQDQNMTNANEAENVKQAISQFYNALNTMFTGDVGPMLDAWSHRDDVTYLGPDGALQVGWSDIKETWKEQAAKKLGGAIAPTNMHVTVGQDLAVIINIEAGENTNTDADGSTEQVSIRATSTLRKEDGQWKVIGHHTDMLSFLAD